MGHLKFDDADDGMLKVLQQHMGYTEEELEHVLENPKFVHTFQTMPTPEVRNSTLVLEVVKSHGCSEGMKVGDKLYFTGLALLDPKRSSPWCAYALSHATTLTFSCHNLILQGIDPNEGMYSNHCNCYDCGSEFGLGQVVMKAYVIKENENK
jgi:uncharacterized repeat protein (TIGR04076 family)